MSKTQPIFAPSIKKDRQTYWRDGRVVECTCLENRRTATYPGFESLSLRLTLRVAHENEQLFFFISAYPAANKGQCEPLSLTCLIELSYIIAFPPF